MPSLKGRGRSSWRGDGATPRCQGLRRRSRLHAWTNSATDRRATTRHPGRRVARGRAAVASKAAVGARNAAHVTRPADTRGAAHRAGRAVGRCSDRSSSAGGVGSGLAERAVWPMVVVVVLVLGEHGGGVPLVDDQGAVEEFAADAADEAFGDRVGPRRPHRRLDDPDVDGGEDGVERGAELGVAVSDEEPGCGGRRRRGP